MKILIVEDEPLIAQRLKRMVNEQIPSSVSTDVHVVHRLEEAIDFLKTERIDLCFLDLNLSGEDGFNLLSTHRDRFHTVITSAYSDKAIEAFEWNVLDFVAKPFVKERLKKAILRFLEIHEEAKASLMVHQQGHQKVLPLTEISFIKAAGNYTQVVSHDQTQYLHSESIGVLTNLLPKSFIRIHKSYLVAGEQIEELKNFGGGKYEVVLKSGKSLPVSRSIFHALPGRLGCV